MSNVVRFPLNRRVPATTIPREEFARLAELALDVVEQIISLLDGHEPGAEVEKSFNVERPLDKP